MPKLKVVLDALEKVAPRRLAFEWDRIGLQVGDPEAEITRAVVSLDRSLAAVEYARTFGAQLLLSHHPLIFTPLATIDTRSHVGRTALTLAQHGINFVAAHTNWDAAHGGINDALAAKLGLPAGRPFGSASTVARNKIVVFCPTASVEAVIRAATEQGAGVIGNYQDCAFEVSGTGRFTPVAHANLTLGELNVPERVEESRIEITVRADLTKAALRAIRAAHPYEEPGIDVVALAGEPELPGGRIIELREPMPLRNLAALVDQRLDTRTATWGDPDRRTKRLAIVGGAADGEWMNAQREGATALLTGEVKQHIAVEATESGCALLAAGHYPTEHPGCEALCERMRDEVTEVEWNTFVPSPGQSGRPAFY